MPQIAIKLNQTMNKRSSFSSQKLPPFLGLVPLERPFGSGGGGGGGLESLKVCIFLVYFWHIWYFFTILKPNWPTSFHNM